MTNPQKQPISKPPRTAKADPVKWVAQVKPLHLQDPLGEFLTKRVDEVGLGWRKSWAYPLEYNDESLMFIQASLDQYVLAAALKGAIRV